MDLWNLIVRFFQGGGDFMYPIAIVLVFGLAIAIERYIYLTRAAVQNRSVWNEVVPLLAKGDFRQVVQITSKSDVGDRADPQLWSGAHPVSASPR